MKNRTLVAVNLSLLATSLTVPATAWAESPSGPVPADSHQFQLRGETNGFGSAMSRTSCDVNGDQFDDTVLGDPNWVRAPHGQVGAAYVLLGSQEADSADLTDPASAGAVRIDGPQKTVPSGAWAGWSVSCLGDVNGDGLDDVVIGTGSRNHHDVAVVFGARDFGPVDLTDIGDRGFVITDPGAQETSAYDRATDNFGYFVGAAGDVDGDGLADIAVADLLADYHGTNSGRVWIVRGAASTATVDVQVDTDRVLHAIDGAAANDRLAAVGEAGDVDGDGKGDLLVGAYSAKPWDNGTSGNGTAFVMHGGGERHLVAGRADSGGFQVLGPSRGKDRLGVATASLGDVNGDGLGDVVVGADGAQGSGRAGGAAVVLGSASPHPVVVDPEADELTVFECADGARADDCGGAQKIARGYWINGAHAETHAGFAVAGMSDVDGDEVDDILIGAYADGGRGAAYVVHVEPERTSSLDLSTLTSAQGERFSPTVGAGAYGRSVGAVGDFDGNGVQDFVFGGQRNEVALVLRGDLPTEVLLDAPEEVVAGEAATLTVEVSTLARSASGEVEGTLALTSDGRVVDGLGAVPVRGEAVSLELPGGAVGQRHLEVVFTPADPRLHRTSEGSVLVDVVPRPVRSRLLLDSRSVSVGDDVEAWVTTTAPLAGAVTFEVDGEVVAQAGLVDGEASVVLSDLRAGEHEVLARYAGDEVHAAFEHRTSLRVSKVDAELGEVSLSTGSTLFGTQDVTATVVVPGAAGGEVTFYDNGSVVDRVPVGDDGVATAVLARPGAGSHAVSARFHGNEALRATPVGEATHLRVRKARLTRIAVQRASFRKGTRPRVKVVLGRLDNGQLATGTVRLVAAGRTYTARVAPSAGGRVVVVLGKLRTEVKVRATFVPTDARNVARTRSAPVTVKLRR